MRTINKRVLSFIIKKVIQDGTKLTEEEAKERILNGQFNASISSTGVSFGTLAGAITYVSGELKNTNGEQQNNDFGNKISADDIKYSDKFSKGAYVNQVTERGWSNQKIADTINNPYKVVDSVNTFTGNPAKAYFINEIHYVVIDTITNKVVQVSDLADDFWKFTSGNFSK
ncbi:MAG: hypothetical protein HFG16_03155 [Erysipelotrichaceae bacterium]|nr:hypothetical protein [Erysipelotrichaceae bacterium]